MSPTQRFDERRTHRSISGLAEPPQPRRSEAAEIRESTIGTSCPAFSADLITANRSDGVVAVLCVRGEIDLKTAPSLFEVLRPALNRGAGPVVVDLSEVTFMDSSGVHVLDDTFRRLERQNRRLAVACCEGSQVNRLLELVGLLGVVPVHRSRESAVADGHDLIAAEPCPGHRKQRSESWPARGVTTHGVSARARDRPASNLLRA